MRFGHSAGATLGALGALVAFVVLTVTACSGGGRPTRTPAPVSSRAPLHGRHLLTQNFLHTERRVLYPGRASGVGPAPAGLSLLVDVDGAVAPSVFGAETLAELSEAPAADTIAALFRERPVVFAVTVYLNFRDADAILAGSLDSALLARASDLRALARGGDATVYLALGHTVNSPIWEDDPADVRRVYGYVGRLLRQYAPASTKLTWYVAAGAPSYGGRSLRDYLPDGDLVDAVGMAVTRFDALGYGSNGFFDRSAVPEAVAIARELGAEVLVVDSAADGIVLARNPPPDTLWATWYEPFFALVDTVPELTYFAHRGRWLTDSLTGARFRERLGRSAPTDSGGS